MKDKLTTLWGILSGVAFTLPAFWEKHQALFHAIGGVFLAIMAHFAKDKEKPNG